MKAKPALVNAGAGLGGDCHEIVSDWLFMAVL